MAMAPLGVPTAGEGDMPRAFTSVVRQFIPTSYDAPNIIVIAQQWPCWLSTVLTLRLPVVGAYFSSRFHHHFTVPNSLKLMPGWSTVDDFKCISEEFSECTILASGSINFLATVERVCVLHKGVLAFAVDHYFLRSGLRDTTRIYRSWSIHKFREGYLSSIMAHSSYGGATNAVHFVMHRGFDMSAPPPAYCVPRVAKHFVNAAARGGFKAMDPPPSLPHDPAVVRRSLEVDSVGRIEGLYNVFQPSLEYAIPCVFKSTGWVRRRFTPKEWLTLHDIPVADIDGLVDDATARHAIALGPTPLVIGHLVRSWWGCFDGGVGDNDVSESTMTRSDHHSPDVEERLEGVLGDGEEGVERIVVEEKVEEVLADGEGGVERIVEEAQAGSEEVKAVSDIQLVIKTQRDLAKAVKADDAEVPVHLWNRRIRGGDEDVEVGRALDVLRNFMLTVHRCRLRRDCCAYLTKRPTKPSAVDGAAMREIVWRSANNEWFEYPFGSRLHFFRFPRKYQQLARDGVPNFFVTPGPNTRRPQPQPTPAAAAVLQVKLTKMIQKRYIVEPDSSPASIIKYFAVPKGEGDARVVYDAGANGLNDCVWSPSFFLPTVDSLLRIVDHSSYMEDRDIGEMFLNFELHPNTRRFTGVDVRPLGLSSEVTPRNWLCWTKTLMGFRSSPYNAVKMYLIVEEVIRGDRRDNRNAFQWDHILLNLPGTAAYNPSEPWITKRRSDGTLASDLVDFVDDERVVGSSEERAREAGHTLSSRESYLGLQDALRKLRPVTRQPGAWAGVVVHNDPALGIVVLTSQDKWDRTKAICRHWLDKLLDGQKELPFKQLESDRGFLVYVTNAYPAMKPYLKGFHLTLEMWRGGRDEQGWKVKTNAAPSAVASMDDREEDLEISGDGDGVDLREEKGFVKERGPPSGFTPTVPRLLKDLEALLILTSSATPVKRVIRRKRVTTAIYGFGDASAGGFGASLDLPEGIHGRFGVWGRDEEDKSSNYRELCNLVETVEEEALAGRMSDTELWLFTDNSTAESCFTKGGSSSELLHELVLRLRKVEMDTGLRLRLVHVAGTRMIAQGTDGLSRGMMCEGVLAGRNMLEYVDIAKCANSRHPPLAAFMQAWTGIDNLKPLTEEEWFVEGHGIVGGVRDSHNVWIPSHARNGRIYWWDPAPVIADVALEEALKAIHKRTDAFHVFTIPRLCTPTWTRLFHKLSDFVVKLPPGSTHWPSGMHEPLFIGISLPLVRYHPWSLRGTPLLVELERQLREVLGSGEGDGRDILCELLRVPKRISSVSEGVARGVLRMPRDGEVPDVSNNGRRR
jgi:hypothetical protein